MSDIVNYEECIKVVQEGVSNSRLASSLVAGDDGREEEKEEEEKEPRYTLPESY
jgi:hypothetical protein